MKVVGERRGSPRATLHEGQVVVFVNNKRVRARAIDISTTGMAVAVPSSVDPGMYLRINFALRNEEGNERWLDADGIVTRSTTRSNERLLGIQFSVVEGHVALHIHAYVERHRQLAARRKQAETYAQRYDKGRTDRYLSAVRDPPASTKRTPIPPGFPGGPHTAPVTGEYGPVGHHHAAVPALKTGTDAAPVVSPRREPRPPPPSDDADAAPYLGGHERLERLYRRALEQLDADKKKKR